MIELYRNDSRIATILLTWLTWWDVRERYDFLYSMDDLEPWVARVKSITHDAEENYVVTNNHNLGKSAVNALEPQAFLSAGPVKVPPRLLESYPELQTIAEAPKAVPPNG